MITCFRIIGLRKETLRRRGWIRDASVRPPASSLDAAALEELDEVQRAVVGG